MCSGISSLGSATRPSGNSGKFWTSCTVNPEYAPGRNSDDGFDRSRLVPARPARARSPAAARGARRPRARRPGVRARRRGCSHGRHASGSRTRFLLECLEDLRAALVQRGGNLVIARGTPERELPKLAERHGATAVYFASDVEPVRDAPRPARRGGAADAGDRAAPHARATSSPTSASPSRTRSSPRSGARGGSCRGGRSTARRARSPVPSDLVVGEIPRLQRSDLVADPLPGGETARAAGA